jgi:hypothetical protein
MTDSYDTVKVLVQNAKSINNRVLAHESRRAYAYSGSLLGLNVWVRSLGICLLDTVETSGTHEGSKEGVTGAARGRVASPCHATWRECAGTREDRTLRLVREAEPEQDSNRAG